jgi:hypothetical protein
VYVLTIIALTISPLWFLSARTAAPRLALVWDTTSSMSVADTPVSSTGPSGSACLAAELAGAASEPAAAPAAAGAASGFHFCTSRSMSLWVVSSILAYLRREGEKSRKKGGRERKRGK